MVKLSLAILLVFQLGVSTAVGAAGKKLSGAEVVGHCMIKNPGKDQRTRLTVVNKDDTGAEKKEIYSRYWKAYPGKGGLVEKMILFTEYPPDAKGAAFMRWGYEQNGRDAEQWIYLPALRKTRRVTVRDLADRFLGSELTFGDITPRPLSADKHRLIGKQHIGNGDFFVVESTPKKPYLYAKQVHWFRYNGNWDECVAARTDYYDHKGQLLKKQYYNWRKVKGAFVWHKVVVENVQTYSASLFLVENVAVNIGLQDKHFDERTLRSKSLLKKFTAEDFARSEK